ncbi:ABC transporter ATP-binding protein [Actinomycetaceae bacterium L2_0104]
MPEYPVRPDPSDSERGPAQPVLSLRDLNVTFDTRTRHIHAVRGIDLDVYAGQAVAIVGESGSGKSVTARSLVGLTGDFATVESSRFLIDGKDARHLTERQWRNVRGRRIGLVLQDALSSLDPLRTVRREVAEVIKVHGVVPRREIGNRVLEVLNQVGFPDPEIRADQYPHQLSGGLRQRALIASALAGDPALLVADEPTTALDVTIQSQIIDLLAAQRDAGTALLLISHDLAVVSRIADRVLVMKDGQVIESGSTADVLGNPQHEYTRRLLRAVPSAHTRGQRLSIANEDAAAEQRAHIEYDRAEPSGGVAQGEAAAPIGQAILASATSEREPVLEAHEVRKVFSLPGRERLVAVDDVSVEVFAGQKLGIVGESGSGKSTLARILLGLTAPSAGEVRVRGKSWQEWSEGGSHGTAREDRYDARHAVQFVSQDPLGSFDPRYTVEDVIAEPGLGVLGAQELSRRVAEVMELTHLEPELRAVMPRSLSGGQRQRASIARALVLKPHVLICDEPVSALDVSIQAQILDLLQELNARTATSLVFISHDLGVVNHLVDDVVVMQHGRIVEQGPIDDVFSNPRAAYTRDLLRAVPRLELQAA